MLSRPQRGRAFVNYIHLGLSHHRNLTAAVNVIVVRRIYNIFRAQDKILPSFSRERCLANLMREARTYLCVSSRMFVIRVQQLFSMFLTGATANTNPVVVQALLLSVKAARVSFVVFNI